MSKITDLYDYFLTFPRLKKLLPITSDAERGKDIFFPRGSSPIYAVTDENIDVLGNYNSNMRPYPSMYDDWQINLYRGIDINDETQDETNINIYHYEDVESICNELFARNSKKHFPRYSGEKVFSIFPTGSMPIIWGSDMSKEMITYAITIRVYYVNPHKQIEVEVDGIAD